MTWRWPWTSMARLDDAKETIERLRAEVDKLTDALIRQQRFERGMTEAPRQPRKELLPMPEKLKEYLDGIGSASIQREIMSRAYKRHGRGEGWDGIMKDLIPPPPEEEADG